MIIAEPDDGQAGALVSQELVRHHRMLHLMRSRMSEWNQSGLDWSATGLLIHLVKGGPQRQGELAACAMLDPSTVSRHVSQLVRTGMVERRPDPADGRAVQLAATSAGEELFARFAASRDQLIGEALSGWSAEDLNTFVRLLRELNDAFEARLLDPGRGGPRPDQTPPASSAPRPLETTR